MKRKSELTIEQCDFITWDYNEEPRIDELSKSAVKGNVYFTLVNDGSDQYVYIASPSPLSEKQSEKLWNEFIAYCQI